MNLLRDGKASSPVLFWVSCSSSLVISCRSLPQPCSRISRNSDRLCCHFSLIFFCLTKTDLFWVLFPKKCGSAS